jgi:DNA polymerase III epsilon subunit-like protein
MVVEAPKLKDIRWDIHKLFDIADIYVAHNIAFDERILKQEAKRIELPLPYKKSIYCTMKE